MKPPFIVPRGFIRFLVNQLHVSTSLTSIVKGLYYRIRQNKKFNLTKRQRKLCYRYAIKHHQANLDLFTRFGF